MQDLHSETSNSSHNKSDRDPRQAKLDIDEDKHENIPRSDGQNASQNQGECEAEEKVNNESKAESAQYPQINLGYCCLTMTLRAQKPSVYTNRTCVKKTFLAKGLAHVSHLALQNVRDLLKVLQWNEEHDIRLFRVSSDMFAFWSQYELEDLPDFEAISAALHEVGDYAKEHKHRLTYHPGPYVVLASPREDVAEKSIIELNRHSQVLDLMGFEPSYYNKCNLHVRGVYDSKIKAMDRFAERFQRLSENCKKRLTVENDDVPNAYSVDDLMYLHDKIGIPIVFDRHHQKFCKGQMTDEEAFHAAIDTWPKDIKPIVHWSESQAGRKPLAHSDYIDGPISFFGCEDRVDCMIEAKCKDFTLLRYRDVIAKSCN